MQSSNDSPVRAFARYAAIATPLAVLVFLLFSGFFTAWEGQAVGVRPSRGDEAPTTYSVVILDPEGQTIEASWPAAVVKGLELPVNTLGGAPLDAFDAAPQTQKRRLSLYFVLTRPGGEVQIVPTTSPRSLAVGVLFWLVALVLHNMYRSGSAFDLVRRDESVIPDGLPQAGVVAAPRASGTRSTKGPPPKGRNKKRRPR